MGAASGFTVSRVRAASLVSVGVVALVAFAALGFVAVVPGAGGRASARPTAGSVAYGVDIQAVFDRRGDPVLVANFAPDGSLAEPSFSVCPPDGGGCTPAESTDRELQPGSEPAGSVFEASATFKGHVYSSSVTWRGTVTALGPPELAGAATVGARVIPVAGRWAGGWGGESDQLGVEACRTANGTQCRQLGGGELGCPDQSSRPRIGNWYTGWYLFAIDARMPADGICAGTGYSTNADLPLWKLSATVQRSAASARVVGPPAPKVAILSRARIRGHRVLVARVTCVARCAVSVTAMGADGSFASGRQSVLGSAAIGVNRRRRIVPGKLRIAVHVGGSPAIVGFSRLK